MLFCPLAVYTRYERTHRRRHRAASHRLASPASFSLYILSSDNNSRREMKINKSKSIHVRTQHRYKHTIFCTDAMPWAVYFIYLSARSYQGQWQILMRVKKDVANWICYEYKDAVCRCSRAFDIRGPTACLRIFLLNCMRWGDKEFLCVRESDCETLKKNVSWSAAIHNGILGIF